MYSIPLMSETLDSMPPRVLAPTCSVADDGLVFDIAGVAQFSALDVAFSCCQLG